MELTVERLKELLHYDPETGVFTWKKKSSNLSSSIKIGSEAGGVKDGYVHITIDRKVYKRSRLAWFYTNSKWPEGLLDHKDGISCNDRIDNLREATGTQNNFNASGYGKSGVKGVYWDESRGLWKVRGRKNNKRICLGRYKSLENAAKARREWEKENCGEFVTDRYRVVEST